MIRLDLRKEDFETVKELILDVNEKPLSKNVSIQEESGKFEVYFDDDQEARVFEDLVIQNKIKILKKRVF